MRDFAWADFFNTSWGQAPPNYLIGP